MRGCRNRTPLRSYGPPLPVDGARQGIIRKFSQGKKSLGKQEVGKWRWVQHHAAWTHDRIGRGIIAEGIVLGEYERMSKQDPSPVLRTTSPRRRGEARYNKKVFPREEKFREAGSR